LKHTDMIKIEMGKEIRSVIIDQFE